MFPIITFDKAYNAQIKIEPQSNTQDQNEMTKWRLYSTIPQD